MTFRPVKWIGKTVAGALTTAFGILADPSVFALLPHKVATTVTVLGAALTAVGFRHAMAKKE